MRRLGEQLKIVSLPRAVLDVRHADHRRPLVDQGEDQHVVMQLSPDLMKKLYKDRGEDMPIELKQQIEELDNVSNKPS